MKSKFKLYTNGLLGVSCLMLLTTNGLAGEGEFGQYTRLPKQSSFISPSLNNEHTVSMLSFDSQSNAIEKLRELCNGIKSNQSRVWECQLGNDLKQNIANSKKCCFRILPTGLNTQGCYFYVDTKFKRYEKTSEAFLQDELSALAANNSAYCIAKDKFLNKNVHICNEKWQRKTSDYSGTYDICNIVLLKDSINNNTDKLNEKSSSSLNEVKRFLDKFYYHRSEASENLCGNIYIVSAEESTNNKIVYYKGSIQSFARDDDSYSVFLDQFYMDHEPLACAIQKIADDNFKSDAEKFTKTKNLIIDMSLNFLDVSISDACANLGEQNNNRFVFTKQRISQLKGYETIVNKVFNKKPENFDEKHIEQFIQEQKNKRSVNDQSVDHTNAIENIQTALANALNMSIDIKQSADELKKAFEEKINSIVANKVEDKTKEITLTHEKELNEAKTKTDDLQKQLDEARENFNKEKKRADDLQEQLSEKQNASEQLKKVQEKLKQENTKVDDLKKQLQEEKTKTNVLQKQLKEKQNASEQLKRVKQSCQNVLTNHKHMCDSIDKICQNDCKINTNNMTLKDKIKNLKNKIQQLTKDYNLCSSINNANQKNAKGRANKIEVFMEISRKLNDALSDIYKNGTIDPQRIMKTYKDIQNLVHNHSDIINGIPFEIPISSSIKTN